MAKIFIEAKDTPVQPFDHLYLVLREDDGTEFVIRGGPDGTSIGVEVGVRMSISEDVRPRDEAASRGSMELDLSGRDPHDVWALMKTRAQEIHDAQITYKIFNDNSNSTVASVMRAVGLEAEDYRPQRDGQDVYPGIGSTLGQAVYHLRGYNQTASEAGDRLGGGNGADFLYGSSETWSAETATDDEVADVLEGHGGADTYHVVGSYNAFNVVYRDAHSFYTAQRSQDELSVAWYRDSLNYLDTIHDSLNDGVIKIKYTSNFSEQQEFSVDYDEHRSFKSLDGSSGPGIKIRYNLDEGGGLKSDLPSSAVYMSALDEDGHIAQYAILQGGAGYGYLDHSQHVPIVALKISGPVEAHRDGSVATSSSRLSSISTSADEDLLLPGTISADSLVGGAGHDQIAGLDGHDSIDGLAGHDYLMGGGGNDTLWGRDGSDVLVGGAGDDSLTGGNGDDALKGGAGNDFLLGEAGLDFLSGGDGNDHLRGGTDINTLDGGGGIDTADFSDKGSSVNVTLNGITASTVTVGGRADDIVLGIENVIGGSAADRITGDAAANVFTGGAGSDTLNGGGGVDTADYGEKTTAVVLTLNGATNAVVSVGGASEDTIVNIENVIGGSAADRLTGDSLANVLRGGAGNDSLAGGSGDDTLVGGLGSDTLDGGAGTDTADFSDKSAAVVVILNGSTNASVTVGGTAEDGIRNMENVVGGSGADRLTGDGNANLLDGGAGADTLSGGAGNDVYVVDNAADVLSEASNAGTDLIRTNLASLIIAQNVENIAYMGTGDFHGVGNSVANSIVAGVGNDVLQGMGGNDTLDGGVGFDTANYSEKTTAVVVTLNGATSVSVTVGGVAEDVIRSIENVVGGSGADRLTGDSMSNFLDGGAGVDTLAGGSGDDVYVVDNAGDVVTEAADSGYDVTRTTLGSYTLGTNVEGLTFIGTGAFQGTGNALANIIRGGQGDDVLDGLGGADELRGGGGNDQYVVGDGGDIIVEDTGAGSDLVRTVLSSYTLTRNVESLTFYGTGPFNGTGNSLANQITSGAGNDTLSGGEGDDTLTGAAGSDTYAYALRDGRDLISDRGASSDTDKLVFATGISSADVAIARSTSDSNDAVITFRTVDGSISLDDQFSSSSSMSGIETIQFADGTVWDKATILSKVGGQGSSGATDGDDVLVGTSGADQLNGLGGNDLFQGLAGSDTIDGGAGVDTADYSEKTAAAVVTLNGSTSASVTIGGVAEDSIRNIENIIGGSAADHLVGDSLTNTLKGGNGNDTLTGGAGDDILFGNAGADRLEGGAGTDAVSYETSSAGVSIYLWDRGYGGDAEGDTYIDIENVVGSLHADAVYGQDHIDELMRGGGGDDELYGNGGADRLEGGDGVDWLSGGLGNDALVGGAGDDAMGGYGGDDSQTGGLGSDTFIFDTSFGRDVVTDFEYQAGSSDTIRFEMGVFTSFQGVLAAATQVGSDVVITYDADNAITLKGILRSNLTEDHFEFA